MKPISLVKEAHSLIKHTLHSGDMAIDATVGNGYDTLFLVEQVGTMGRVYGFDVQETALDITRSRLQQANLSECLTLIQANHAAMAEKIPVQYQDNINAIMFNLGYLPGGDKTIITQAKSTLLALNSAAQLLSVDGVITVIAYPGHNGGDIETNQVKAWCEQLDQKRFTIRTLAATENKASAPVLFAIFKTN